MKSIGQCKVWMCWIRMWVCLWPHLEVVWLAFCCLCSVVEKAGRVIMSLMCAPKVNQVIPLHFNKNMNQWSGNWRHTLKKQLRVWKIYIRVEIWSFNVCWLISTVNYFWVFNVKYSVNLYAEELHIQCIESFSIPPLPTNRLIGYFITCSVYNGVTLLVPGWRVWDEHFDMACYPTGSRHQKMGTLWCVPKKYSPHH